MVHTLRKKKTKKKLKSAIAQKQKQKQSQSVRVSVSVGEKKKKRTKKASGKKNPFYTGGMHPQYGGALGGPGYGSLGMAGFQNPYASADLIAQSAQRAVYDSLGTRTITGPRAIPRAPGIAEQQAAVQAAQLRAEVQPVRPAQPVPMRPYPREDVMAQAQYALGQHERMAGMLRGREPAARRAVQVTRRRVRRTVEQRRRNDLDDVRADVAVARKQNEQLADDWGGYSQEALARRRTRAAKQGMTGLVSNAQTEGSGGGSGLLVDREVGIAEDLRGIVGGTSPEHAHLQGRQYETQRSRRPTLARTHSAEVRDIQEEARRRGSSDEDESAVIGRGFMRLHQPGAMSTRYLRSGRGIDVPSGPRAAADARGGAAHVQSREASLGLSAFERERARQRAQLGRQ